MILVRTRSLLETEGLQKKVLESGKWKGNSEAWSFIQMILLGWDEGYEVGQTLRWLSYFVTLVKGSKRCLYGEGQQ